jgi:hypothetical protein
MPEAKSGLLRPHEWLAIPEKSAIFPQDLCGCGGFPGRASNAYTGTVPGKRENGKVVVVIDEQT